MSQYIIKNCPGLLKGAEKWAKGFKEDEHFCNESDEGKWCQYCTDCVMKQIVKNLKQVAYACHCDNCDGCGYYSGCSDTECGTYQALKSLELLDIQEVE